MRHCRKFAGNTAWPVAPIALHSPHRACVHEWLTMNGKRESDRIRSLCVPAVATVGALAVGAVAVGALAVGVMAIGRPTVGRLAIKRARIGRLGGDELVVKRLVRAE